MHSLKLLNRCIIKHNSYKSVNIHCMCVYVCFIFVYIKRDEVCFILIYLRFQKYGSYLRFSFSLYTFFILGFAVNLFYPPPPPPPQKKKKIQDIKIVCGK